MALQRESEQTPRQLRRTAVVALEPLLHRGQFLFPFLAEAPLPERVVEQVERLDQRTEVVRPIVEPSARFGLFVGRRQFRPANRQRLGVQRSVRTVRRGGPE